MKNMCKHYTGDEEVETNHKNKEKMNFECYLQVLKIIIIMGDMKEK